MRALTIRQPWAHAIMHLGKRIENRSWTTSYRGPLLIHAAKGITEDEYLDSSLSIILAVQATGCNSAVPEIEDLQRGGIIGVCDLMGIIPPWDNLLERDMAPMIWWQSDSYGWLLKDVRPLPFIPCRGKQGLWTPDRELLARVAEAQEAFRG